MWWDRLYTVLCGVAFVIMAGMFLAILIPFVRSLVGLFFA